VARFLVGLLPSPEKVHRYVTDDDEVLCGVFGVNAALIFSECDIELPMEPILDGRCSRIHFTHRCGICDPPCQGVALASWSSKTGATLP